MINIPSTVKISLRALRVNKMRSALTMLGIIIGVGAVITMLAVSGLFHYNAYKHIFWCHVIATLLSLFVTIPLGILIYG